MVLICVFGLLEAYCTITGRVFTGMPLKVNYGFLLIIALVASALAVGLSIVQVKVARQQVPIVNKLQLAKRSIRLTNDINHIKNR